ncbi:hypothetical protein GCM10023080_075540 [Streptomyces pseudoechinosporeus]
MLWGVGHTFGTALGGCSAADDDGGAATPAAVSSAATNIAGRRVRLLPLTRVAESTGSPQWVNGPTE